MGTGAGHEPSEKLIKPENKDAGHQAVLGANRVWEETHSVKEHDRLKDQITREREKNHDAPLDEKAMEREIKQKEAQEFKDKLKDVNKDLHAAGLPQDLNVIGFDNKGRLILSDNNQEDPHKYVMSQSGDIVARSSVQEGKEKWETFKGYAQSGQDDAGRGGGKMEGYSFRGGFSHPDDVTMKPQEVPGHPGMTRQVEYVSQNNLDPNSKYDAHVSYYDADGKKVSPPADLPTQTQDEDKALAGKTFEVKIGNDPYFTGKAEDAPVLLNIKEVKESEPGKGDWQPVDSKWYDTSGKDISSDVAKEGKGQTFTDVTKENSAKLQADNHLSSKLEDGDKLQKTAEGALEVRDSQGRLKEIQYPDANNQNIRDLTFDPKTGQPASWTDGNGHVWTPKQPGIDDKGHATWQDNTEPKGADWSGTTQFKDGKFVSKGDNDNYTDTFNLDGTEKLESKDYTVTRNGAGSITEVYNAVNKSTHRPATNPTPLSPWEYSYPDGSKYSEQDHPIVSTENGQLKVDWKAPIQPKYHRGR